MDYQLLFSQFTANAAHTRWPRQRQLHECLRHAIRQGTLGSGARLPASRTLAQELGVSRNTVLYAYNQLATEGFVRPDQRGTVVAPALGAPTQTTRRATASRNALSTPEPNPHLRAHLSRRALSVPIYEQGSVDAATAFTPGVPALQDFPLTLWRRLLERAWRTMRKAQLNYADPQGEAPLREAIANHLRVARGALLDSSQVFITDGTQHSLDIVAHAFADAGDKMWIESPGYLGALAAFKGAQLKPLGMVVDAQGIAPSAADWQRHRPRLVYVTPSHQFPTGTVLSLERRLALIAQARAAGSLLIEDDYDSEFRHDGPPLSCMQGLAPDAPVIYLGTFSKTLFPALRIGFMVVPAGLVAPLRQLLSRSAPRGRVAEQWALADFMHSGQFSLHLRRMRRLYRQRRDALVAELERQLGGADGQAAVADVYGGSAGMHLALRLRDPQANDVAMSHWLRQHGLVAHALSEHTIGQRMQPWRGFVLGYAQVPAEQMAEKVALLAKAVRLGTPP
ncbi:PLP-dependent aminotransferase family protein [Curvibacter sp. CHRR-16]|uniref:MocR-like pyridoxine biosynthesis transcription factor PdxR n=1 Tax=Curvibacter sp. CHRR-16 TaxID=2835872 RepID=UPI001BDA36BC|nr:PLP-dependent aminotransferase family protein [Curvibacter sp. CHRR-16]MBT0570288.1 PLP-dependent aminotransferase family protein [Curvibacter sp. CHRR-16]